MRGVTTDQTRREIRDTFRKWDIDPSEFEIVWEEERESGRIIRRPGATVRYYRAGTWQLVSCFAFYTRQENLRQCFLLLDRLRIAEQHGVQYQGLTHTTDLSTATNTESSKKESLLDAYDILGVSPDDPLDLIKSIYQRKSLHYHPDKGGDPNKFKRLTKAFELIMKSRGTK